MGKVQQSASLVDVDGYGELVARAVGLEVNGLTAARRDDPRGAMLRMVAAYLLLHQDKLSLDNIAQIVGETESWVRNSTDYVARRIGNYYAFRLYVDQMKESYARVCMEAGKVSGAGVDAIQRRIAQAVGMTVKELVAFERDNDAGIVQKVAAYLLLSHDELSEGEAARVMCKSEQWVLSAKNYVERHLKRGDQALTDFVTKTTALYGADSHAD